MNTPSSGQKKTIVIRYDDGLVQTYRGTPYNDSDPEENLHLYEKSNPAHEIPVAYRNKDENYVKAEVENFENEFVLFYKSPVCMKNNH